MQVLYTINSSSSSGDLWLFICSLTHAYCIFYQTQFPYETISIVWLCHVGMCVLFSKRNVHYLEVKIGHTNYVKILWSIINQMCTPLISTTFMEPTATHFWLNQDPTKPQNSVGTPFPQKNAKSPSKMKESVERLNIALHLVGLHSHFLSYWWARYEHRTYNTKV